MNDSYSGENIQSSTQPIISLIVPVYNVALYIERCIRSLLNQRFREYEIIIIDDGSMDRSGEIARKLLEESKNSLPTVKIIRQDNQGLSAARNKGIAVASGRYLWFIDSDDCIAEDCLTYLVPYIEKKHLQCLLFREKEVRESDTDSHSFYRYGDDYSVYLGDIAAVVTGKQMFMDLRKNHEYGASVCGYIFDKDILNHAGLCFYPNIIHEDELFTPQLLFYADRVSIVEACPYIRFIHDGSITTSAKLALRLNSNAVVIRELYSFYCDKVIVDELQGYAEAFVDNIRGLVFNYIGGMSKIKKKNNMMRNDLYEVRRISKQLKISFSFELRIYCLLNSIRRFMR